MKKIKYYLLLVLILLYPIITKASNYKVDNYDFIVDVSEKRVYSYEENINVIFDDSDVLVTKELDKSIKDIDLNTNYIVENQSNKIIKIDGQNNKKSLYNLKYTYNKKDYDKDIYEIELTNTWNAELKNISFYITLDEDFNKNNVDFYLNGKKLKNIDFEIDGTTIKGTYESLEEYDVLLVKVDYTKLYFNTTTGIATIVPIILTIISGLLWYLYGKDLKYNETKATSLPNNLNPLDLALLYKGIVKENDLFSLLLHLANNGYIKIIENSNNDYTIKRLKEYDGKNYKEALFLKSLFRKNSNVTLSEYIKIISDTENKEGKFELDKAITKENIYQRFQRTKKAILPLANDKEEKNKYFEKTSERKKAYLMLILATILILLTSVPFIEINKLYLLPISVIFSIITLYILMSFVENSEFKLTKKNLITLTILSLIVLVIMLLPAFRRNRIYIITFFICTICIIAILAFYKYMPKRTLYGTKLFAKVEAFKKYIYEEEYEDSISKEKNYLLNILPFAYILGLESYILKKIKKDNIKPNYYEIKSGYTPQKFINSLSRIQEFIKTKNEDR